VTRPAAPRQSHAEHERNIDRTYAVPFHRRGPLTETHLSARELLPALPPRRNCLTGSDSPTVSKHQPRSHR